MGNLINNIFQIIWILLNVGLFVGSCIILIDFYRTNKIIKKSLGNSTKRVLLGSREFELMARGEWLKKDDLKISFHDIINKIQNEKSKK